MEIIQGLYKELEMAYMDFDEVDSMYSEMLEVKPELKENYEVVNGMDCGAYTEAVDTIYSGARRSYEEYRLAKTTSEYDEVETRFAKLVTKIGKATETVQIEKNLERLKEVAVQIVALKKQQRVYKDVDWQTLLERMEDTLDRIEGIEDEITMKLKPKNPDVTVSNSPDARHIEGIVTSAGTGAPLMSVGTFSQNETVPSSVNSFPVHSSSASSWSYTRATPTSQPAGNPPPASGLYRMKLDPVVFSGLRKRWPEFKSLWNTLVKPEFQSNELLAYQLRQSVKGNASTLLENIPIIGPQAYDIMWERLCLHYEDATATVNEIMKEIQSLKPIKQEDYRSLTAFVNKVEGWFAQLASISHLECMGLMEVDSLCMLLPVSIREEWHERHLNLSENDQLQPFTEFTVYLREKRRAVSRLLDHQPANREESGSHGTRNEVSIPKRKSRWNCVVHQDSESVTHVTADCNTFIVMTREEKIDTLKAAHACFRCFGDHLRRTCRFSEPCQKCGRTGHHTLMCLTPGKGSHPLIKTRICSDSNMVKVRTVRCESNHIMQVHHPMLKSQVQHKVSVVNPGRTVSVNDTAKFNPSPSVTDTERLSLLVKSTGPGPGPPPFSNSVRNVV